LAPELSGDYLGHATTVANICIFFIFGGTLDALMQQPSTLKRIWFEIWDIIKFLAPIVVIVFVVRTYIAQPFIVDGESMSPNFHTGHYLIIDELSYRFHAHGVAMWSFLRYRLDTKRFFLKRIVGLPGDRVALKDGKVYITNAENPKRCTPCRAL
jgi:signal peptidase I